jgi:hypothetical protein
MAIRYEISEHDGSKRIIELNTTVSLQDFFVVLCCNYELAARFILDWYPSDSFGSSKFIASLLTAARKDLNLMDSWLSPKNPVTTMLHSPGSSVCRIALLRFCELLYESPALIKAIKEDANYLNTTEGPDFFSHRETNVIALTHGTSWEAKGFRDTQPIPIHIREQYYEQCRLDRQKEQERREQEEIERNESKTRKSAERLQAGLRKNTENKINSDARKLFRERILSLPLIDQVIELATNEDYPVQVFPTVPSRITKDIIASLTIDQRRMLIERIIGRWENDWISLRQMIEVVNNDNNL